MNFQRAGMELMIRENVENIIDISRFSGGFFFIVDISQAVTASVRIVTGYRQLACGQKSKTIFE